MVFIEQGIQLFLGILHDPAFRNLGNDLPGYDLGVSGKMLFPQEEVKEKEA